MRKALIVSLLIICVLSCKKEKSNLNVPPPPPPSISVTVDQDQPGFKVPSTFEGLSFETQVLTADQAFLNANNKVVVQLIKNLGPGILRIGGGTSDEVFWSGNPGIANSSPDTLRKTDIDRLSSFSNAIGWPVIFGLNLGNNDADETLDEALYVRSSLGNNLYALQSGNEPDVYDHGMRSPFYDYTAYQGEWESYFSKVRSEMPGVPFAGPDVAYNASWIISFAENESKNVTLLDGHYYTTGPASNQFITYHDILSFNFPLNSYLQSIEAEASSNNLPYRITESNNVYGGGKAGVSDVFASALWALDVMWTVAQNHGSGINFHDGDSLHYSPIVNKNGVFSASPEYYAMLAFKFASENGTIIPATSSNFPGLCSVYACSKPDNSYTLTLINKDDKQDYVINVQLTKTASSVQIARLSAPSITSSAGITFAGAAINSDGILSPQKFERHAVNGKSFYIEVPAASAVVVTVK
jgi:hypothetical protein